MVEGNPDRTLQYIALAAGVVDDHVAQFFGKSDAPGAGAFKVCVAQLNIENIGGQCAPGIQGHGLVVELSAQGTGHLHGLRGLGTKGEGATNCLFNAFFNVVKQSHVLSSPSCLAAACTACS